MGDGSDRAVIRHAHGAGIHGGDLRRVPVRVLPAEVPGTGVGTGVPRGGLGGGGCYRPVRGQAPGDRGEPGCAGVEVPRGL